MGDSATIRHHVLKRALLLDTAPPTEADNHSVLLSQPASAQSESAGAGHRAGSLVANSSRMFEKA
jgi:hypothetical protein